MGRSSIGCVTVAGRSPIGCVLVVERSFHNVISQRRGVVVDVSTSPGFDRNWDRDGSGPSFDPVQDSPLLLTLFPLVIRQILK